MGVYDDPAGQSQAVTASDSVDLPSLSRGIRVSGTVGNVALEYADGDTDIIPNVQIGEILPVRARKILATGTTAAGFTVFW